MNIEYKEGLSITYVTQEPACCKGDVQNFLCEGLQTGEDDQIIYTRFKELCNLFDLPEDFEQRPLETLSSGELKKLDIAKTLARSHQLLLLDEPLNYMDVYFKAQLETALLDDELTLVFVEHNEEFGERIANKVLEL